MSLSAKTALALFVLVSLLHLIAILLGRETFRKITKVFLMPPLIFFYAAAAKNVLAVVLLGAVFGWFGDILLIRTGDKRFFILGLSGFLLGHLCYIFSMLFFTGALHIPALIVSAVLAAPLWFLVNRVLNPGPGMRIPVKIYSIIIELMILSALQLMLYRRDLPGLLAFTGGIFFGVSDSILGYYTFRTLPRYGNLPVMLSYITGQGCILAGLAYC
ncbi:MAG: lysoplasmalogenase [Treponema sp.]|jgi:uncharacterized membrane protein YhhN|nr:lysoplasmalogenase [Treponema sp.]